MVNLEDTAKEIIEILKNAKSYNIQDNSGYYIVKEDEERDISRAVDVSKGYENGKEFYVVYVDYEDESSDWFYTEDLTYDSLLETLYEIAESDFEL